MTDDLRKAPSAYWYLAAAAIAVVGWFVGVSVAGQAWDTVRAATITSSNEPLQADGRSVAVFSNILEPERSIVCTSTGQRGKAEPLGPRPVPLTIDDDGSTWYLVAFQIQGHDDMVVSCAPEKGGNDSAQYAFATVDGFERQAKIGSLIMTGSLLASFGAAVVLYILRRRLLR